jgi:SAM-dependent MidA family methyltransferase
MTPLFGASLARQVAPILAASERRDIVELGAGTGRLAASLIEALESSSEAPARYRILETSPDLRERQRALLAREIPRHLHRVEWISALPPRIDGAVIANEVLDAIPVHIVRRDGQRMLERGVTIAGVAQAPRYGLAWAERSAPEPLAALAAQRFPEVDAYSSELNPAAEALVEDIGRRLASGAALFIDYGFPAREYYHPQRSSGTVMCHYRHRAHDDPLFQPGLCDISAHVDFTAMAAAGERAGLRVTGFCPQAAFLLGCGILDRLAAVAAPESLAYMKAASQVQHLLSPAEMGELFKVLALARSGDIAWPGFAVAGTRYRL